MDCRGVFGSNLLHSRLSFSSFVFIIFLLFETIFKLKYILIIFSPPILQSFKILFSFLPIQLEIFSQKKKKENHQKNPNMVTIPSPWNPEIQKTK